MKYYKVLYRDVKNNLMSVGAAFDHPSELILEYVPGEETVAPEGTKLFIFDDYIHAVRFVTTIFPNHLDWTEIWEVEAKSIRNISSVFSMRFFNWSRYMSYWRCMLRDNARTILNTMRAPVGTLVCDSVILKRRIYYR